MNTSKTLNGKTYTRRADAQRAINHVEKRENIKLDTVAINQLDSGVFEVVLPETKVIKTLVIHPMDRSTDFLKPIYENVLNKTVITGGGMDVKEVNELIKSHDRVMMMGHGCPSGLFSVGQFRNSYGLVISHETVELLKEKTDNVYIWCNADMFVNDHELKGFYSGMFVSEVGEAWGCIRNMKGDRRTIQEEVTLSNNTFAEITGKYINNPSTVIHENVVREYGELAQTSVVAQYNNERLYVR